MIRKKELDDSEAPISSFGWNLSIRRNWFVLVRWNLIELKWLYLLVNKRSNSFVLHLSGRSRWCSVSKLVVMSIILCSFVNLTVNARVNSTRNTLFSIKLAHWLMLTMSTISISQLKVMSFEVVFHFNVFACFCLVLISSVW